MTAVGNNWLLRYLRDFQLEISPVPQGYGEAWCICGRRVACVTGSPQPNQWFVA